jgi:hypothetical protein
MKQLLFIAVFASCAAASYAQYQPVEYYNTSTQSARASRGADNPEGKTTIIEGKKVAGVPFLYDQWLPATITLEDGRVFDNYKIKYDTYHQSVFFLSGKDSLEVADPIKDFVLEGPLRKMSFTNAGLYKKQKRTLYYEILADAAKGQLLKAHRKVLGTDGSSLVDAANAKFFKTTSEYFYYNIATDKLIQIGNTAQSIRSDLKLTKEQEEKLNFSSFDFSKDTDVITFFKSYMAL